MEWAEAPEVLRLRDAERLRRPVFRVRAPSVLVPRVCGLRCEPSVAAPRLPHADPPLPGLDPPTSVPRPRGPRGPGPFLGCAASGWTWGTGRTAGGGSWVDLGRGEDGAGRLRRWRVVGGLGRGEDGVGVGELKGRGWTWGVVSVACGRSCSLLGVQKDVWSVARGLPSKGRAVTTTTHRTSRPRQSSTRAGWGVPRDPGHVSALGPRVGPP